MGFEPKTLDAHGTHAYPLSHQGHKEPWTRWIYILKVKCEIIKETVSARKDHWSLPWDLNTRPLTLMVHMLIHWAIRDTRNHELVEYTSLRWSVRSLKRQLGLEKTIGAFHGVWTQDPWRSLYLAYPLSHQGHKEPWTRRIYILKVKCEVIKKTVSARKDQRSLPWDLNPRPLTLMVPSLSTEPSGTQGTMNSLNIHP